MTYCELKRLLKRGGFYLRHQENRHEIWENPTTGKQFPVGRYNA
jgi:hypothetical protein